MKAEMKNREMVRSRDTETRGRGDRETGIQVPASPRLPVSASPCLRVSQLVLSPSSLG